MQFPLLSASLLHTIGTALKPTFNSLTLYTDVYITLPTIVFWKRENSCNFFITQLADSRFFLSPPRPRKSEGGAASGRRSITRRHCPLARSHDFSPAKACSPLSHISVMCAWTGYDQEGSSLFFGKKENFVRIWCKDSETVGPYRTSSKTISYWTKFVWTK